MDLVEQIFYYWLTAISFNRCTDNLTGLYVKFVSPLICARVAGKALTHIAIFGRRIIETVKTCSSFVSDTKHGYCMWFGFYVC